MLAECVALQDCSARGDLIKYNGKEINEVMDNIPNTINNDRRSKVYVIVAVPDSAAADLKIPQYYGMIGNYMLKSRLVSLQDDIAFIDLKYKTPQATFALWQDLIRTIGGAPTYIYLDYDSLKPAEVHTIMRFFEQACVTVAPLMNPIYQVKTVWRAETLHNTFTIGAGRGPSPLLTPRMMEEAMLRALRDNDNDRGSNRGNEDTGE